MLLRVKGYMTVYLSLSISIILSLILTLYSGARIGAIKMKVECSTDIAMNSVLAEYNKALFERYGLLLVDTSYGGNTPGIRNVEEHLKYYMQNNFALSSLGRIERATTLLDLRCKDVKVTGVSFASDNNGAVLRRQILEYMKAEPIEGLIAEATNNLSIVNDTGMDETDVLAMARENTGAIESIEVPKILEDENEEKEYFEDPVRDFWSITGGGILPLVLSDGVSVSQNETAVNLLLSHRNLNKGTGLDEAEDLSITEVAMIDQYIIEKCGCYGNERDNSALNYQLEYILEGSGSDAHNLESIASKLFMWRAASNAMHVFSDDGKKLIAQAAAAVISFVTMQPEAFDLITNAFLFAWAIVETVSDLKCLYNGGKVPLLKNANTWRTDFSGVLNRSFGSGQENESGLDYTGYLRIMLLMQDLNTKTERLMDIMEMDVRKTPGNSAFLMDYCMDIFCAEIKAESRFGYKVKIERIYGYETYS